MQANIQLTLIGNMTKQTRNQWLQSLKKGDKVWSLPENIWGLTGDENIWEETFDGWFDFRGHKGDYCWVDASFDGGIKVAKNCIFPTKKDAEIAATPKRIKALKQSQKRLAARIKKIDKLIEKAERLLANNDRQSSPLQQNPKAPIAGR
jgi:hypothetical protein